MKKIIETVEIENENERRRSVGEVVKEFGATYKRGYSALWAGWLKIGMSRANRITHLKAALTVRAAGASDARKARLRALYKWLLAVESNGLRKVLACENA